MWYQLAGNDAAYLPLECFVQEIHILHNVADNCVEDLGRLPYCVR